MHSTSTQSFAVNGREFHPPQRPLAVICLDGSADEYFDAASARGRMPNLARMAVRGYRGMARGALPSFTNVNNSSIITGVPPSVHGIGGNFFYDTASGQEVMMNSAKYLRADTILAGAARAGRRVAVVTAKEKLRDILGHQLRGIAFSTEKANQARQETHGIDGVEQLVGKPTPPIYSPEASLYVLWAGVALIKNDVADFLYLSTTDYMQHTYAPEAPEALDFYAAIDAEIGRLLDLGAIVGLTADHGMNSKQTPTGEPNVIYLETELVKAFGPGFRVILPITDPYVVHHGALGSFAVIHLPPNQALEPVRQWLGDLPGITEVYDGATAARKLELPADRLGELVALSKRDVVIGRSPEYHDLKALHGGLRSHGGRYEEMVPFVISEPLKPAYAAKAAGDPRNFDIFDFVVNGTQP
jgi:phosphonoacetate hydrolase